jgi:hypothetical protein
MVDAMPPKPKKTALCLRTPPSAAKQVDWPIFPGDLFNLGAVSSAFGLPHYELEHHLLGHSSTLPIPPVDDEPFGVMSSDVNALLFVLDDVNIIT